MSVAGPDESDVVFDVGPEGTMLLTNRLSEQASERLVQLVASMGVGDVRADDGSSIIEGDTVTRDGLCDESWPAAARRCVNVGVRFGLGAGGLCYLLPEALGILFTGIPGWASTLASPACWKLVAMSQTTQTLHCLAGLAAQVPGVCEAAEAVAPAVERLVWICRQARRVMRYVEPTAEVRELFRDACVLVDATDQLVEE